MEPTMELWGYINLHKLDLTISKYHIRYLTNSYKTMEYHQLWRPLAISAPLPIPGCGSPRVSLTDECSPTVPRFWFFFRVAGGPIEHFLDGLYHFIPIKMLFMMVLWWFIPIPLMVFDGHWMVFIVGFTTEKILNTSCPGTDPRCLWHG